MLRPTIKREELAIKREEKAQKNVLKLMNTFCGEYRILNDKI